MRKMLQRKKNFFLIAVKMLELFHHFLHVVLHFGKGVFDIFRIIGHFLEEVVDLINRRHLSGWSLAIGRCRSFIRP